MSAPTPAAESAPDNSYAPDSPVLDGSAEGSTDNSNDESTDGSTEGMEESGEGSFLSGLQDMIKGMPLDDDTSEHEGEQNPDDVLPTDKPVAEVKEGPDPDLSDLHGNASAKTKEGWKALKVLKRQAEQERDTARAEIEALKQQPASLADNSQTTALRQELESTKKRVEEYDREMALVDVERSDEYKTNISVPLSQAESLIQEFAAKYELDIPSIAKAAMTTNILERNSMLSDMVGGMNDFDKFEFKKVVDEARALFGRSQQVKANASESRKYLDTQREQQTQAEQERTRAISTQADETTWGGMTKTLDFITKDTASAAALKRDAMEADLGSASPEIRSYVKHAAVMLPKVLEHYKAELAARDKEIANMKAGISKRTAASPNARSGAIPPSTKSEGDGEESFMGGLEAVLRGSR